MKEGYIDLHVHTNYSDGSFTPKEVVEYCKKVGVIAVGITDHDNIDGIKEAIIEGEKLGVEVVPGVEISCDFKDSSEEEIHILGYYIDYENAKLKQTLKFFQEARQKRAYKIFNKLVSLGIPIKEEDVFKDSIKSIGRLHFARVLKEKNLVSSIGEAFELYLGYGKPAYEAKLKVSPKEAISLIVEAKGIPILAHPYLEISMNTKSIKELIEYGIKGIEVYHSKHPKNITDELLLLAEKYDLLITGGSDCHGSIDGHPPLLGSLKIPYKVLENIKMYKEAIVNS
jgi:predicted metal-dependent phosphoesterase TrpH